MTLEILPIRHLPEVRPGDDLAGLITGALAASEVSLQTGDILCVAQKVISKAEGAVVDITAHVEAAKGDVQLARRAVAREQAARVVADTPFVLIVETSHGFVCANAGVDGSNTRPGTVTLLPDDSDASAEGLRQALFDATGLGIGIIVTDTFGRPWRVGQTEVALGVAGIAPLRDERGSVDREGNELEATIVAVADELASAADLVRSKSDGCAVVLIRGFLGQTPAPGNSTGQDILRVASEDLFRVGGPEMATQVLANVTLATGDLAATAALRSRVTAAISQHRPDVEVSEDTASVSWALNGSLLTAGTALRDAQLLLAAHNVASEIAETGSGAVLSCRLARAAASGGRTDPSSG